MQNQLYLVSDKNFPIKIHKSMVVGRDDLRLLSDNYKYVSREQFKLEPEKDNWFIQICKGTTNKTYLNNEDIIGSRILNNNDRILVGNIKSGNGLYIKVILKSKKHKESIKHKNKDTHEIIYHWLDYNNNSWEWKYFLPKKTVEESINKFGITGKVVNGKIVLKNIRKSIFRKRAFRDTGKNLYPDYNRLTKDNINLMSNVAESLRSIFKFSDKHNLLMCFLNFVQAIPYRVPANMREDGRITTGLLTPPELLVKHYGDCDSKAVLLATLWKNIYDDPVYFGITKDHVFIGFSNIPEKNHLEQFTIEIEGLKFLLCEAAGPGITYPGWLAKKYKIKDYQILM